MDYKDYYAVLGIKKEASAEEIKRAYRKLAREHHPDLHPEHAKAKAAEKFREINEAYQVLSDPEKRAKYDQLGPHWEAPPRPQARPRPEAAQDFGGFSDFFEGLFGQAGRQGFGVNEAYSAGPQAGQDIEAELPLSLEDAYAGGEKKLAMALPALCPTCGGTGRVGRGFCPTCGGVGETRRERTVTVRLPKYVADGTKLRLRGQGSPGAGGREPGDLFLRVRLQPHPRFKVSGSDVETAVTLLPSVAFLGGEAVVEALDGPIRIRIPAGTHAGKPFRIPGKGLGKGGDARGDLYAVARVDIPELLDGRLEKAFRELKEAGA